MDHAIAKRRDVIKTRLGNVLHRTGLVGAAISVLYTLDSIWIHQSGKSLVLITGRYVSREDIYVTVVVGIVLALLSWRAGVAARSFVNKSAEKRAARDRFWYRQ